MHQLLFSLHKNKTSLKLRNLSLHNDCIKKLKSISITRSSSIDNSINSMKNKNIKTINLAKIEPNNYTAVKKLSRKLYKFKLKYC